LQKKNGTVQYGLGEYRRWRYSVGKGSETTVVVTGKYLEKSETEWRKTQGKANLAHL